MLNTIKFFLIVIGLVMLWLLTFFSMEVSILDVEDGNNTLMLLPGWGEWELSVSVG